VFAGASALLRAQPVIIYETTSANRDRLTALLTGLGYRLFDAEGYGQHDQISPNVLAWPTRLHHRTEELLKGVAIAPTALSCRNRRRQESSHRLSHFDNRNSTV
jgi:hypothetical protein